MDVVAMINAREIAALRDSMHSAHEAGELPAVVTLLQVDGSAYRKPGAKMLVRPNGETTCMLSGGCLEPEIAEVAQAVVAAGEARRVRYDLSEDEVWGLGLGCGGAIDLYIEPVSANSVVAEWVRLQAAGEPAMLATVFGRLGVQHELYRTPALLAGVKAGGSAVARRAGELFASGAESPHLERLTIGGARVDDEPVESAGGQGGGVQSEVEVFFDVSASVPELILFGGGPSAVPLAALAAELGFRVVVVDPRSAVANAAGFPEAEIVAAHPEQYPERVRISAHSSVVIMNHHLERDREALVFTLERKPAYVGMLGPRRRFEKLLTALDEQGRMPDDGAVQQVHNPVGLDIGAEGPEEIALSVLAEILAVRRGHAGAKLTDKKAGIHDRGGHPAAARS